MHPPKPVRIVLVILLIGLVSAAGWYYYDQAYPAAPADAQLSASGTIEAREVRVAAEVGGRILRLGAAEGDLVSAGQPLVRLDDALLQAQVVQAQAAVQAAEASLVVVTSASGAAESAVQAAEAGVEALRAVQRAAQANLDLLRDGPSVEQLAVSQTVVDKAQLAVDAARDSYDSLSKSSQETTQGKALKAQLDQAQATLDNAVAQYNLLKAGARDSQVEAAQAQVDSAAAQVAAAEAQAAAARQQADAAAAQVRAAEAQAASARAALDLLAVQQARFQVNAPAAGTVLYRTVEVGEVAAQGAPLFIIADLANLEITVYVPEDRYGEVLLGQGAAIKVDSFPGENFYAEVVHIADQAEFTPRNVQTQEGRRTTVFAVRLKLADTGGRLKPGMPADVIFIK